MLGTEIQRYRSFFGPNIVTGGTLGERVERNGRDGSVWVAGRHDGDRNDDYEHERERTSVRVFRVGGIIRNILCGMFEELGNPPLARWDGLHLVLDLRLVEHHLQQRVSKSEFVDEVSLVGAGDAVRIAADVKWKGLSTRVRIDLAEIRLKRRFLGLRLRRPKVFGGVPVPMGAVELLIRELAAELVTVFRGEGIVVVDLRRWIPSELDLSVLTVQATDGGLHLWLGPGSLLDLPGDVLPGLPSGSVDSEN